MHINTNRVNDAHTGNNKNKYNELPFPLSAKLDINLSKNTEDS